jgi:hypothetical protein
LSDARPYCIWECYWAALLLRLLITAGEVGLCWALARTTAHAGWNDLAGAWRLCGWLLAALGFAGNACVPAAVHGAEAAEVALAILVVAIGIVGYYLLCLGRTIVRAGRPSLP